MSVLVLCQARMGSRRLPGKMLLPLGGVPLVSWSLRRLSALGTVVCCTTSDDRDDLLAASVPGQVVRGSEDDVLGRCALALDLAPKADLIVRATGDNPLVLPELALGAIEKLNQVDADYCSIEESALGTTVEVLTRRAFETLLAIIDDPEEREHLTLGLLRRPERFRITQYIAPPVYRAPGVRLTVDTPEDFDYLRDIVGETDRAPEKWTWAQIAARIAELPAREVITQERLAEVQALKARAVP